MPRRRITPPGTHVVEQGEDAISIAWAYGFKDWETVWNHAQNAAVRDAHPSPKLLCPGAEIFVPENTAMRFELPIGQTHRVVVDVPTTRLETRFYFGEKPLANQAYVFTYEHGGVEHVIKDHTTDSDGVLREEAIPMGVSLATVFFPKRFQHYRIRLRALDPIRRGTEPVVTGVQARLNNLGFRCGTVDGRLGPRTLAAIRMFQSDILGREDATGELDEETLTALEAEHRS